MEKNKTQKKTIWQTKKLGEVCDVFTDGNWIEKKDQSIDGIRLVQTGNVGCGFFKDKKNKVRYISEKTFKSLKCTEVFQGDCLVSRLPDPVGRSCIIPNINKKMITAVDCSIIRFKKSEIIPEFFNCYSQSNKCLNNIKQKTTGTTRERISRKNLGLIQIPLPPLPEQIRIVKILDEVFGKMEIAKKNAERNLRNAKEFFESYLQEVFDNGGSEWEEKRLGEVCEEIFAGGDKPKDNFSKFKTDAFQIPIFSNGVKNDGLYGYTNIARIKKPSITISARGTIGYSVVRKKPFLPIIRLIVLSPKDDLIDLDFLHYSIKNNSIIGNGTSIPQLTVPAVKKIKISFPKSLTTQKQIVSKLDALSASTKKLEKNYQRKIDDLDELKKSVLKKAFEGEL